MIMKNPFKKNKEQPKTDFELPGEVSGTNKYERYMNREVRERLAKDHLNLQSRGAGKKLSNKISEVNKRMVEQITYQPYYLLQFQANYFCGTCKYETQDTKLKETMEQVIRGAFLYGKAGIFFDKQANDYYGVAIEHIEHDIFNNITSANVIALSKQLTSTTGDLKEFQSRTLNEEQCKDLIIFRWGVLGLSAWIVFWPFVQFQAKLLQMYVTQAYSFNKKFTYVVNDPETINDEIEAFFDPLNPFIIQIAGTEVANRFSQENLKTPANLKDFVDYYIAVRNEYYHILGRKINVDEKKERNITSEVEASQENYDIVQSDWLKQFQLFIEKLNQTSWCPQISIVKEEENDVSRNDEQSESETRVEE